MIDYTRIIEEIVPTHGTDTSLADSIEREAHLVLNGETRQITPGSLFQSLVGTTDDINTNIITIRAPLVVEGHRIADCEHKVLKWVNLSSGDKGLNELDTTQDVDTDITIEPGTLEEIVTTTDVMLLKWVVPTEALTAAGQLKISLCFYDTQAGITVYRWNSLPFTGLTVGQGMDEISTDIVSLDEIIALDMRTRKVKLPSGLNREIGKQGETALTTLRFRYDRYYQNIDFGATDGVGIKIFWKVSGEYAPIQSSAIKYKYVIPGTHPSGAFEGRGDIVEFDWTVPKQIIDTSGNFEFAVCIIKTDEAGARVWYSDTCSELKIGTTLTNPEWDPSDEVTNAELYIVDSTTLNERLSLILGEDEISPTGSMTVTEALTYTINRFMDANITMDSGDASQYYEK